MGWGILPKENRTRGAIRKKKTRKRSDFHYTGPVFDFKKNVQAIPTKKYYINPT